MNTSDIYNETGHIKTVCHKKLCHAPIWIREYELSRYIRETNPLLCAECWRKFYNTLDILCTIKKESDPEWSERYALKEKVLPLWIDNIAFSIEDLEQRLGMADE